MCIRDRITQGRGRVGVVAGVPTLMGHVARLRGFRKRLARCADLPVVLSLIHI